MKTCRTCKIEKELSNFYKDKQKKDGLYPSCKECVKIRVMKYNKVHKQEKAIYDKQRCKKLKKKLAKLKHEYYLKNKERIKYNEEQRHIKYPWKRIFMGIKDRCNNPNNHAYKNYGERGIENFLEEKDVKFLYIRDNAKNMKNPSIDRIDNDGNYELSNCEFIEKIENTVKDKRKSVIQYDLNGNFIKKWRSAVEACTFLNISNDICSVAKGKRKACGGFIWRYANV